MRTEVSIIDASDEKAKELRFSDDPIDISKKSVILQIIDISQAEGKEITRVRIVAQDLLEAARIFVARMDKVTDRY